MSSNQQLVQAETGTSQPSTFDFNQLMSSLMESAQKSSSSIVVGEIPSDKEIKPMEKETTEIDKEIIKQVEKPSIEPEKKTPTEPMEKTTTESEKKTNPQEETSIPLSERFVEFDVNLLKTKRMQIFSAIVDFIEDLNSVFGKTQKSLQCYKFMLNKIQVSQTNLIDKFNLSFWKFIYQNQLAIKSKNISLLKHFVLIYSNSAYIDFGKIFKTADTDSTSSIWEHLVNILSIFDPKSGSLSFLKTMDTTSNEGKFISSLAETVQSSIDPNETNPFNALSKFMSSGGMNKVLGTMNETFKNGNLDIGKMLSSLMTPLMKQSQEK